jgi:hypothetical protein
MSTKSSFTLAGTVLDPSGAVISGAQITLKGEEPTLAQSATTNAVGQFLFDHLAPGVYKVSIQALGFQEKEQNVRVSANQSSSQLRISLLIATQNQVLTVGGQDDSTTVMTDAADNQNANIVDRDALDRVPVLDQDYITTLSRFLDDSALGTNGVTLVVNGLEANGPGVTPSAVQEVKINQNPYSALFSRPGRARLEILTKGGTPELHGTINFLIRNSAFDARNSFAEQKPPEQRQFYEGSLTGPLSHNKKTSFLLSLDQDFDDTQAFINAQLLSGAFARMYRRQSTISSARVEFFTISTMATNSGSDIPTSTSRSPTKTLEVQFYPKRPTVRCLRNMKSM